MLWAKEPLQSKFDLNDLELNKVLLISRDPLSLLRVLPPLPILKFHYDIKMPLPYQKVLLLALERPHLPHVLVLKRAH